MMSELSSGVCFEQKSPHCENTCFQKGLFNFCATHDQNFVLFNFFLLHTRIYFWCASNNQKLNLYTFLHLENQIYRGTKFISTEVFKCKAQSHLDDFEKNLDNGIVCLW